MKSIKTLLTVLVMVALATFSCSKDDDKPSGPAEGKMTSTIDGSNVEFNVAAIAYNYSYGNQPYEGIIITGSSGTTMENMKSFAITVYAQDIKPGKYDVPVYNENYTYDYLKGFSMAVYIPNYNDYTDYYLSYLVEGSAGSVTVTDVSDNAVIGTYDMTLVNSKDYTKKMTLKGAFNAKLTNVSGY